MVGYSAAEVSELLGWPTSRIYALVRDQLASPSRDPRGHFRFAFSDLVVLRAIRDLIDQGVPPRRLKRSLKFIHQQLPDGRPLSAVRLSSRGSQVVVRDGDLWFEAETGQVQLPLDASATSASATPLVATTHRGDSDAHYHRGLEFEGHDPGAAQAAYRQAIASDGRHADAYINLGRLLQDAGDLVAAEQQYRSALAVEPDDPLARFNLGTVLEDLDDTEAAIACYRQCVDDLPDAHYNLARLFESLDRRTDAIIHLRALRLYVAKNPESR